MVAASILPVTIHKNQLYFLFGKENPMEDSSKGWSDFGGGVESGETLLQTASREGAEELSGFLGNPSDIRNRLKKNRFMKLVCNKYHIHLFYLPYDENLPFYYNKNHYFLWNKMDKHILNKSKLFEKIEVDWFSIEDMKKRKNEFRSFYKEMIDLILENNDKIKTFIALQQKYKISKNRTKKQKNKIKNRKSITKKQKTE